MSRICIFLLPMKTVAMSSSEALSSSKQFSLPLHIMPSLGVFVICAMLEGRTYISKLLMMLLREVLSLSMGARVL